MGCIWRSPLGLGAWEGGRSRAANSTRRSREPGCAIAHHGMRILRSAWQRARHRARGARPHTGIPTRHWGPPPLVSSNASNPYLPLYPNMRKRTQKMMHVTPMWIPMMMPVVEVLLFCSSFMQSQGGFSTARRRGTEGQWCCLTVGLPASGELRAKAGAWVVLGAVYGAEERRWGVTACQSSSPAPGTPGRQSQQAQDWEVPREPAQLPGLLLLATTNERKRLRSSFLQNPVPEVGGEIWPPCQSRRTPDGKHRAGTCQRARYLLQHRQRSNNCLLKMFPLEGLKSFQEQQDVFYT